MLRSAARLLEGATRVALIIHQQPDGDAVGSAFALRQALQELGKIVSVVCVSSVPALFTAVTGQMETVEALPEADAYVLLDCSDLHRTGCSRQIIERARRNHIVIAIDHHQSSDWHSLTKHCFVNTNASSTAEIIYELLTNLRVPISPTIATALLLGVYTDTGGFTHANTTDNVLRLAGRLGYCGADLGRITHNLSRTQSAPKARLWGSVMSELEITKLGVVIARVRQEQFDQTETTLEDIGGLANALALVEEARVALVLIETSTSYRGILRTRHHHINLGRLARLLGGAGRPQAAGFTATKERI